MARLLGDQDEVGGQIDGAAAEVCGGATLTEVVRAWAHDCWKESARKAPSDWCVYLKPKRSLSGQATRLSRANPPARRARRCRALRSGGFGSESVADDPTLPAHELLRRASLARPPDDDPIIKWRPARRLITAASAHLERVLADVHSLSSAPLPSAHDDPAASAALKKAAAASVSCVVAWGVALSRPVTEAARRYAQAPMDVEPVSKFRLEPLSMWSAPPPRLNTTSPPSSRKLFANL